MERVVEDITGVRFGRLVVLERIGSKVGRSNWRCRCDCGNVVQVTSKHLRSGESQSCGCLRRDRTRAARASEARPFEDRLVQRGECLEWSGARDRGGYGTLRSGKVDWKAHRLAWVKANGPIPEGMVVCHTCDNPPCCNPDHLFLGAPKENSADMVKKGRSLAGSRNYNAKLTDHVVREIRRLYGSGLSQQKIADRFGVAQTTVSRVVLGASWGHVT